MNIQENIKLVPYTTLGVGGSAEYFVKVGSESTLLEALDFAVKNKLPVHVMGGGSNLLISDKGIKGLVIKNEISDLVYKEEESSVFLTVGAGLDFDTFIQKTIDQELWGLENLSGIPGTVGATPVQNVGAYGVEVSKTIVEVRALNLDTKQFVVLSNNDCNFTYRDSFFKTEKGRKFIITSVTYKLSKTVNPVLGYKDLKNFFTNTKAVSLSEIRNIVLEIRAKKFPDWRQEGTAGSFFKNPIVDEETADMLLRKYPDLPAYSVDSGNVKISLGYILDKICGLRGYREGNVGLYEKQALVLVNYGDATSDEIEKFAEKIAKKVYKKTKVKIEREVNTL